MSFRKPTLCLLVALLSPPLFAAWGSPSEPTNKVGQFDFGYQISGVRDNLLHVFDNGAVTYFQFRNGANPPVLFSLDSGAPTLLQVKTEGAYFTVNGVFKSFQLQNNGRQMLVITYQGDRPFRAPSPSSVVISSVQKPSVQESSIAVPVAGDVINETVYRVTLPFVIGKNTMGRKGESELAQIVQLAKASGATSIRIFAPIDPGGTSSFALMRAAEIQRKMTKAGLPTIKYQLDTITPEPIEDVVMANIDMIFEKPLEAPVVQQPVKVVQTVVPVIFSQPQSPPAQMAKPVVVAQEPASSVPVVTPEPTLTKKASATVVTPMQVEPNTLKGSFRIERLGPENPNALMFDMSSVGKKMTPAQITRMSHFYGDALAGGRFVVKTDATPTGDAKGRQVKFQLERLGAMDVVVVPEGGRQMIEISKEVP